jgi:excisionase family DNA binding protein
MSTQAVERTYSPKDQEGLGKVYDFMQAAERAGLERGAAHYFLSGTGLGEQIELPEEVYLALQQVVDAMRYGLAVSVVPVGQTLTTQQAAELLGVSRPHVVKLIEKGELPHQKVGTHRRILLEDVLRYREARRQAQYAALAELYRDDDSEIEDIVRRTRKARKKVAKDS